MMNAALAALVMLATPVAGLAPATPSLRLPGGVRPVRQSVELTLDPARETFTGRTVVDLEAAGAVPVVWLNARGLEVREATLHVDGRPLATRVVSGDADFVGFAAEAALQPGPLRLEVAYTGKVERHAHSGLFSVEEGGERYLFSQFQPIDARRAFPCFDEPGYKIPWRLTLRVPRGLVALANTPSVSSVEEPDGLVVRFAETKPLPSYLVAVAVGPFEVVEAGRVGRGGVPLRFVVPRGRGGDLAWARESTGPLLALLEDYFGSPYPYEKLDQVAIPGAGYAMEHPGLVTYGQSMMVQRPGEETLALRRGWASLCAHELAHMWFGDMVTAAWWDDLWLNEAFSSWLGEKVTARFRPEWGLDVERAASRLQALRADSLATARRIRQPIASRGDILTAFDGITYAKGKAVLEMVEAWLGEQAFRAGVVGFVERHAWGNASADDFLRALSTAAGRDVAPVVAGFLDQTGAPVVSAAVACAPAPGVTLRQTPYRPLGSPAEAKAWQTPVCVKYATAAGTASECFVAKGPASELRLARAAACPEWVFANAAAAGYYRLKIDAGAARGLVAGGRLSAAERVALVGDLEALVASGDVGAADALGLATALAADAHWGVVEAGVRLVRSLGPFVPEGDLPRLAAFIRERFGPRARELGWSARAGEDEDTRLLRGVLVPFVAEDGEDAALGATALALARGWLEAGQGVDPDVLAGVLGAAVQHGDAAFFERVREAALAERDRRRRALLLQALRRAPSDALFAETLALCLDERLEARETIGAVVGSIRRRSRQAAALAFARRNFAALAARLPGDWVASLAWVGSGVCDRGGRREFADFFAPRLASADGGPQTLAQALELADQCIAQREHHAAGLTAFLQAAPRGGR